jgi:hypothetical protein
VARRHGLTGPEIGIIATTITVALVTLVLVPVAGHEGEYQCNDAGDTFNPWPTYAALCSCCWPSASCWWSALTGRHDGRCGV